MWGRPRRGRPEDDNGAWREAPHVQVGGALNTVVARSVCKLGRLGTQAIASRTVGEVGVEPTDNITRLSTWPLSRFAYSPVKSRIRELHSTAGLMRHGRALAHPQKESRERDLNPRRTAYETVLGARLQSTPR